MRNAPEQDAYWREIIDPGDRASKYAREICVRSYVNSPAVIVVSHDLENFRGSVGYAWPDHILDMMFDREFDPETGDLKRWTMMETPQNDGAGSKPQFFALLATPEAFYQLGWELIAMNADDLSRFGSLPVMMVANEIQAKRITDQNFPLFQAMMDGYGAALSKTRMPNITGEVAVMKQMITGFCDTGSPDQLIVTWGGVAIGLTHNKLRLDARNVRAGMTVVGFWEPGYRCNGGTRLGEILMAAYGHVTDILANPEAMDFVSQLTVPSLCYSNTVTRVNGWLPNGDFTAPIVPVRACFHITGGGVWGKFADALPTGVGAVLDNMPPPTRVLLQAQDLSWELPGLRVSDLSAYQTFHGGCGMLSVVDDELDAMILIDEANQDGVKAQIVGHLTASEDREVLIHSRFREGRTLSSKELKKTA